MDEGMARLRRELVTSGQACRAAAERLVVAKALAEQRAIDAAGGAKGLGANEDERKRALVLALAADPGYQAAAAAVRQCESHVARVEAELEILRDRRRAEEWAIRQRLADALLGVPSDGPAGDDRAAWDDAMDERLTTATIRRNVPEPVGIDDLFPS